MWFRSFRKSQKGFFCLLFSIAIFPSIAGEQDSRDDAKGLYLVPSEVIRVEELQILDSETRLKINPDSGIAFPFDPASPGEGQGAKDVDLQIVEAEGLLRRYYSQFLNEKRIWEDKNRGSKYSTKNEQNEVRLLIDELLLTKTETQLIRDSEIIYSLHKRLGDLYNEKKNSSQSIRHYTSALRYRDLSHTEDRFLEENSWKEVLNSNSLQARKNHKIALENKIQSQESYDSAKRMIHKLGSDFALNKINFLNYQEEKKSKELEVTRKKQELDDSIRRYDESYLSNYQVFQKSKSREDAELYYKLAVLVRQSEESNKERLKIVNKSSLVGRGIFILFDYKRNTDFYAYEYLLEKAYKVDPNYPEVMLEVAKQFKIDGKKLKAIDYFEKYTKAQLTKGDGLTSDETETLADCYLNLAILNSDLKRKVIAANYYELFQNTTKDEEKKKSIVFELGRFYEKIIGDLDKAKYYYENWLASPKEGMEEKEATSHYGISLFYRRERRDDQEEKNLLIAYEKSRLMQEEITNKEKAITKLERDILKFKKDLLLTTQDDSLAQFRILNIQLEDLMMEKDKQISRQKTIPTSRIILRLAELNENKKDFVKAKEFYQELVETGNEVESNFSLKSLRRVEKTQEDGIIRERDRLY
jgi:hypothetical protein